MFLLRGTHCLARISLRVVHETRVVGVDSPSSHPSRHPGLALIGARFMHWRFCLTWPHCIPEDSCSLSSRTSWRLAGVETLTALDELLSCFGEAVIGALARSNNEAPLGDTSYPPIALCLLHSKHQPVS